MYIYMKRQQSSVFLTCVLGVSVLAIGIANADIHELKQIALPTTYKNLFFAADFDDLPSIEREVISSLCSEALMSEFQLHKEVIQPSVREHYTKANYTILYSYIIQNKM